MKRSPHSRLAVMLAAAVIGASGLAAQTVERFGAGEGPFGGSLAVRIGEIALAHTAQALPTDGSGSVAQPSEPASQARLALANLERLLSTAGSSLGDMIRLNAVVAHEDAAAALRAALADSVPESSRPATTMVQGSLPLPGALLALDAVAIASRGANLPVVQLVSPPRTGPSLGSPASILPAGPTIYIAGRAADGGPSEATSDVLNQLQGTLEFLGVDRSQIVRLKCFLRPIADAPVVARAIDAHFDQHPPPVVFVEWTNRQTLEIEAVAAARESSSRPVPAIEFLTPPGLTASPVFSRVTRVGPGQAIYTATLHGSTAGSAGSQIREAFTRLAEILGQTGSDLLHLAKATYYVADEQASRLLNEIRPEFYDPDRPPAASKASVRGTAVAGQQMAMDMIAVPAGP